MAKKIYVSGEKEKDLQVLDYIESTGTQWIDTGIVPKTTTRIVIDLAYTTISASHLMGWGSSGSAEAFYWGMTTTEFVANVSGNYTANLTGISADTNRHIFDLKKGSLKFDGVEFATTNTLTDTATTGQTLYLFGHHVEWNTAVESLNKVRVYSCKIYNGDTLIRDFTPILDENGVACLYDRVNKSFYYNKGTGVFTAGALKGEIITLNKATQVKNLYVGVDNIAKKIKKGYIGVDGIARLFYRAVKIVEFTSCPFPTSWTAVSSPKTYTYTNEYGIWNVAANSVSSSSTLGTFHAYKAFDNNTGTNWQPNALSSNSATAYIEISLENGLINPKEVYLKYKYVGNSSNKGRLQGYNPETNAWENLHTLTQASEKTETITLSTETFYSKIRLLVYRYTTAYSEPYIYELKVTKGTMKIF